MTGIKSHFVPQFYLRNFGEKFFFFDKKRQKIHSATPRTVAHKSNFYGPMIDGTHPLESAFSQIEGESSLAINELIKTEDPSKLSGLHYPNLCKFIALQYLRTEEFRKKFEEAGNFAFRELFAASHPQFDKNIVDRLSTTDELNLVVHLQAIRDYPTLATVIHYMKFILIKNKTDFPFWTSDNPIVFYNSIDYSPYSGLGIVVEGIELHVPINPKLCLIICDPKKFQNFPNTLEFTNKLDILRENWLQVDSADRFVFSNLRRFNQIKKLLTEHKNVTNTKRKRTSSRIISGKELNKNHLKYWADQEILDHLQPERNTTEIPPYERANPNADYISAGLKRTKSKYDPKIHKLKF